MAFIPADHRFALVAARFDWCESAKSGKVERARTGLHFDGVRRVQRTGFDPAKAGDHSQRARISFEETDAPAGAVTLTFSGGAALRLDVECLDAQMRDMGRAGRRAPRPPTPSTTTHPADARRQPPGEFVHALAARRA